MEANLVRERLTSNPVSYQEQDDYQKKNSIISSTKGLQFGDSILTVDPRLEEIGKRWKK